MSEILFDKNLIKSVAAELGMDEKKIEHHMKFMTSHISELQHTEGLHAIRLPYVGTMYRNIKACSDIVQHLGRYKPKPKRLLAIAESKVHIEGILEGLKTFEHFSLHNYKRRLNNPYFKLGKKRHELEKFQNND